MSEVNPSEWPCADLTETDFAGPNFVSVIEVTHEDGTRFRWERGKVVGGHWRLRSAEPGGEFEDANSHNYNPSDVLYDLGKEIVKAEVEGKFAD